MLQNTQDLTGYKLAASDGDIGHIKDFYFNDESWAVRYAVVDTGSWLSGRLVLLAPRAFGLLEVEDKKLGVNLTRKQIEDSPPIETHRPVSRQYEEKYYGHYGWPVYWEGSGVLGATGATVVRPPQDPEQRPAGGPRQRDDIHLRSAKAVVGHDIEASDGSIGSVSGFMVDDKSWAIRALVVEAGHWYSGKEILIAPAKVARISYEESKVFVNLTKAEIERTDEHHLARTGEGSDSRADFPTD
ncbi:MAG: PRC-barrel domain-containing protein [Opitutaceae bacterium]|nr:PRC-barrel domain-containing protein [Opitutaceae bacterium]